MVAERLRCVACAAGLSWCVGVGGASAASWAVLPTPSGADAVTGLALSPDGGTVVGRVSFPGDVRRPFAWSAVEGLDVLATLPGEVAIGEAAAVSGGGGVILGTARRGTADRGDAAVRWAGRGGAPALLPGFGNDDRPEAVTPDGAYAAVSTTFGFGWRANPDGSRTGIDRVNPGDFVTVSDVSDDGSVVVGRSASRAFVWTEAGGSVALPVVQSGFFTSFAASVSPDGRTVIGASDRFSSGSRKSVAVRWNADGTITELTAFDPEVDFTATAMSDDGGVIIGSGFDFPDVTPGFVWTEAGGAEPYEAFLGGLGLDVSGWSNVVPVDISGDGLVILSTGVDAGGARRTFVVEVPAPGVFGVAGVVWAGLARGRRRGG